MPGLPEPRVSQREDQSCEAQGDEADEDEPLQPQPETNTWLVSTGAVSSSF